MGKKINPNKIDFSLEIKNYIIVPFRYGRKVIKNAPHFNPKSHKNLILITREFVAIYAIRKSSYSFVAIPNYNKNISFSEDKFKDRFQKFYTKESHNAILLMIQPDPINDFLSKLSQSVTRQFYRFFGIAEHFLILEKNFNPPQSFYLRNPLEVEFKEFKKTEYYNKNKVFVNFLKYALNLSLYDLLEEIRKTTGDYYINNDDFLMLCNNLTEIMEYLCGDSFMITVGDSKSKNSTLFQSYKIKNSSELKSNEQIIDLLNKSLRLVVRLKRNALVEFLYYSILLLITDLEKFNKIRLCPICANIFHFKNGKKYCSQSCRKKGESDRYYAKKGDIIKERMRNYMREQRKIGGYIDKRRYFKDKSTPLKLNK